MFRSDRLFCEVFREAVFYDPLDQLHRQRLVERELNRPARELVLREFVLEHLDAGSAGVKADVAFIRCKVDEVAFYVERRYSVGNLFRGVRDDFQYRLAQRVELLLHVRRELEDVIGDGGGHGVVPPNHNCYCEWTDRNK